MKLIRYPHGCRWENEGKFSQAFVYRWTAWLMRGFGLLWWSG
jgi:hypothetical protein